MYLSSRLPSSVCVRSWGRGSIQAAVELERGEHVVVLDVLVARGPLGRVLWGGSGVCPDFERSADVRKPLAVARAAAYPSRAARRPRPEALRTRRARPGAPSRDPGPGAGSRTRPHRRSRRRPRPADSGRGCPRRGRSHTVRRAVRTPSPPLAAGSRASSRPETGARRHGRRRRALVVTGTEVEPGPSGLLREREEHDVGLSHDQVGPSPIPASPCTSIPATRCAGGSTSNGIAAWERTAERRPSAPTTIVPVACFTPSRSSHRADGRLPGGMHVAHTHAHIVAGGRGRLGQRRAGGRVVDVERPGDPRDGGADVVPGRPVLAFVVQVKPSHHRTQASRSNARCPAHVRGEHPIAENLASHVILVPSLALEHQDVRASPGHDRHQRAARDPPPTIMTSCSLMRSWAGCSG